MSINLRQLSPDTYAALKKLCTDRNWPELNGYAEPEIVAWLTIRLEYVEDTEESFPRGKWATIQHLQTMLRDYAQRETAR